MNMLTRTARRSRTALAALWLLCVLGSSPLPGDDPPEPEADATDSGSNTGSANPLLEGKRVIRVEEDWIIDVAVTDGNSTAPEVVTVFGPDDPNTGLHAVFELNHSTYPSFDRGGMQIQGWQGGWLLAARRHPNESELSTVVERIRFTCVTRVNDGRLTLQITNGSSATFGAFGGDRYTRVRFWTQRDNLNSYNPQHSIQHSRVTFGANRVNQYLRCELRYYTDAGEVIVDPTDVYVHRLVEANVAPDPVNE